MKRRPPRSTLFPSRRSSDLLDRAVPYWNRQVDSVVPSLPSVLTPCPPLPSGEGGRSGRRREQAERETRRPGADRLDQLGEEGAPQYGDFGVGVAFERIERERHAQAFAVLEKRPLGLRQTQLGVIGAEHGLLDAGEHAVALQQRPDTGIGQRIGVGDLGMPVYEQTPSRGFTRALRGTLALGRPLRLSAFHAGSASMSTSASGRRSTCATSVMARPVLVKPVSRTRSPYSGRVPAGCCSVVTPPIGSIDSSASSSSVTCTPSRWRFVSQRVVLTTWLVPRPRRRRPGTHSVSNRRSSRLAF